MTRHNNISKSSDICSDRQAKTRWMSVRQIENGHNSNEEYINGKIIILLFIHNFLVSSTQDA